MSDFEQLYSSDDRQAEIIGAEPADLEQFNWLVGATMIKHVEFVQTDIYDHLELVQPTIPASGRRIFVDLYRGDGTAENRDELQVTVGLRDVVSRETYDEVEYIPVENQLLRVPRGTALDEPRRVDLSAELSLQSDELDVEKIRRDVLGRVVRNNELESLQQLINNCVPRASTR